MSAQSYVFYMSFNSCFGNTEAPLTDETKSITWSKSEADADPNKELVVKNLGLIANGIFCFFCFLFLVFFVFCFFFFFLIEYF